MKLLVALSVLLGMPTLGFWFVSSNVGSNPPFVLPVGYQGQPECVEVRKYTTTSYELRWLNANGTSEVVSFSSEKACMNTNPTPRFVARKTPSLPR